VVDGRVVLLLRIRLRDGNRCYATPASSRNGKAVPLAALVNGKVEHHPEGVYALRYREQGRIRYRQVGTDYDAAETARLRLELELRTQPEAADRNSTETNSVSRPAAIRSAKTDPPMAPATDQPMAAEKRKGRTLESLTTLRESFIRKYAHGSTDTVYAYTTFT